MLYLDTSAFLKLLVDEEHSGALREALEGEQLWSSSLLDVEAHRAAKRLGLSAALVDQHLDAVNLVALAEQTMATARTIGPDGLRTLDAVHLAAALEFGTDLEAVVTYDRRLAEGFHEQGVAIRAPGRAGAWWRT